MTTQNKNNNLMDRLTNILRDFFEKDLDPNEEQFYIDDRIIYKQKTETGSSIVAEYHEEMGDIHVLTFFHVSKNDAERIQIDQRKLRYKEDHIPLYVKIKKSATNRVNRKVDKYNKNCMKQSI